MKSVHGFLKLTMEAEDPGGCSLLVLKYNHDFPS
jgi:hypothetical protein